jgi:hypothetical protein
MLTWKNVVTMLLPSSGYVFTNYDMYKNEGLLARLFPRNRHIRDKIRQTLQRLSSALVVKHLGRGIWKVGG